MVKIIEIPYLSHISIESLSLTLPPGWIIDLIPYSLASFTVSENGYLFTIQKNEGNIIRINDIYKDFNLKKRKKIKPTGFTIGGNNLYLTNSDGNLIVISLSTGNVLKIEKVGRDLISKPFIYNENLFIVKNGSITQYD